jgi:hypothetical protein
MGIDKRPCRQERFSVNANRKPLREHSKCDQGLHDLSDRGPTRVYPELPVASEQAHLLGSILPAKNQPVPAVRYLPSAKSAHEHSTIIDSRNRTNSIVAKARIPLRVMTLPKTLCKASTFRRDASRISTLIKKVLDSCGKCGHSLEIGGFYGALSPTIHS